MVRNPSSSSFIRRQVGQSRSKSLKYCEQAAYLLNIKDINQLGIIWSIKTIEATAKIHNNLNTELDRLMFFHNEWVDQMEEEEKEVGIWETYIRAYGNYMTSITKGEQTSSEIRKVYEQCMVNIGGMNNNKILPRIKMEKIRELKKVAVDNYDMYTRDMRMGLLDGQIPRTQLYQTSNCQVLGHNAFPQMNFGINEGCDSVNGGIVINGYMGISDQPIQQQGLPSHTSHTTNTVGMMEQTEGINPHELHTQLLLNQPQPQQRYNEIMNPVTDNGYQSNDMNINGMEHNTMSDQQGSSSTMVTTSLPNVKYFHNF